jgi:O-antigen ligase
VIFAVAPSSYFDRMNTITNPTDGSAQGRIQSWRLAWNQALGNPILGVGAGNTPYLAHQNAHSIYFMVLGELGFPGLFILLAYIIGNLRANRQTLKACRAGPQYQRQRQLLTALSASLMAYAVAGAFLSAAYYPHAYILAGLLTAGRRIVREQTAHEAVAEEAPAAPQITYHWALAPSSKEGL